MEYFPQFAKQRKAEHVAKIKGVIRELLTAIFGLVVFALLLANVALLNIIFR